MSTPSFLNVPYRLKAGTLYSQIPETGAGDFAVTRVTSPATNRSTRINADGFIEIVNDNVPRLDYPLGGAVNGCPALLVEPSAENLVLHNNDFGNAYWTKVNTTTASSADPVVGTQWQVTDSSDILPQIHYVWRDGGLTGGSTACGSKIYAKAGTLSRIRLSQTGIPNAQNSNQSSADINLSNGQVIQSATDATFVSVKPMINGWYEIEVGTNGTLTNSRYSVIVLNNLGNSTYQGDGTGTVFIARAMKVNNTLICGSDIPTTTAAITRAADVITKTGIASLIGQTEGTLYAEVDMQRLILGNVFALDVGGVSEYIAISKLATGAFRVTIKKSSASAVILFTTSANAVGIYKIALGYKNGDYAMSVNGATPLTSSNSTDYPTGSLTQVVVSNTSYGPLNDRIRAAAVYPNRLSNAELIALTTP
jgi:hypothetical protein